ncbi:MAG: hemerythrin domain-containing protein [Burkholderiales bacterium]|nr:hemerythrin domain-containing protein [Burkholderiales bacterium]
MNAVPRPLETIGGICDEPFAMLEACHGRLRRALVQMERLAARLPVHGCDAQAAQIATDVLCYFDFSAPLHHEDEERHILPLLRAAGDEAFAAQIEQEHHELHRRWIELRGGIAEVASGTWVTAGPGEFVAWARFATLYRAHVAAEEAVAFPAAQALLSETMTKAIGREMAERRGLA